MDQDKLILTDDENCPRYKQVDDAVAASAEWTELFNDKMPSEYLNANLYLWLR